MNTPSTIPSALSLLADAIRFYEDAQSMKSDDGSMNSLGATLYAMRDAAAATAPATVDGEAFRLLGEFTGVYGKYDNNEIDVNGLASELYDVFNEAQGFINETEDGAPEGLTEQDAADRSRVFDVAYADLRLMDRHDRIVVKTQHAGIAAVDIVGDEELQQALSEEVDGDYMNGTPSIEVRIGSSIHYLNWSEAYSLGFAMCRTADVAHYG